MMPKNNLRLTRRKNFVRNFFFLKNEVHVFSKRIAMRLEKIMRLENEATSSGKKKFARRLPISQGECFLSVSSF
jgi:hypothetical protein